MADGSEVFNGLSDDQDFRTVKNQLSAPGPVAKTEKAREYEPLKLPITGICGLRAGWSCQDSPLIQRKTAHLSRPGSSSGRWPPAAASFFCRAAAGRLKDAAAPR